MRELLVNGYRVRIWGCFVKVYCPTQQQADAIWEYLVTEGLMSDTQNLVDW